MRLNEIGFCQAIQYEGGPKTATQWGVEKVDGYFCPLGGKKVVVVSGHLKGYAQEVSFIDIKCSWLIAVLKIISYCTLIFPLIALVAKAWLRSEERIVSSAERKVAQEALKAKQLEKQQQDKERLQQHQRGQALSQATAAIKIQTVCRGHLARKKLQLGKLELEQNRQAATTIQAAYKGYVAKKKLTVLKAQRQQELKLQEGAATTIQAAYKGYVAKKKLAALKAERQQKLELQEHAATTIQTTCKEHLAKKKLAVLKAEQRLGSEKAAMTIQSTCKGYLAKKKVRREYGLLTPQLVVDARSYIDNRSFDKLPVAYGAKARVYFPENLPIILKQLHFDKSARERFNQMQQGRQLCQKNNYRHLVIPDAWLCGSFVIETRIPIKSRSNEEQIGFDIGMYIENRDRFTNAIKEFVGFLCQSTLSDITGNVRNFYQFLDKTTPIGRYDNLLLHLEKAQGKIGLIDLEEFSPQCHRRDVDSDWCYFRCRDAVCLFPHHLEEILSVAKTFYPAIETEFREALTRVRDRSLERFKLVYHRHIEFFKENAITLKHPEEIPKLTEECQERLKESIAKYVQELHVGKAKELYGDDDSIYIKGRLGVTPEESIKQSKEITPKIIGHIMGFISNCASCAVGPTGSVSSLTELVSIRKLYMGAQSQDYRDLLEAISSELPLLKIAKQIDRDTLAKLLMTKIFEKLVEANIICYFKEGLGERSSICIFY